MKPLSYSTLTLAQDMLNTLAFAPGGAVESYRWDDIPQASIDDATDLLSALCMHHDYDATLSFDDDILQVIHPAPTHFPRMELSHDLDMLGTMLAQTPRIPVLHLYSSAHDRNLYLSHSLLRPARIPHILNSLLASMQEDSTRELNTFLVPLHALKEEDYNHIPPDNRLPTGLVRALEENRPFEGLNSNGEYFRSGIYYTLEAPLEDQDLTLNEITSSRNDSQKEYGRLTALCDYLAEHYALPAVHQHLAQGDTTPPRPVLCISTPFFDALQDKLHPRTPTPFITSPTPLQDMHSIIRRGSNNLPFALAKTLLKEMEWDINQSVTLESLRERGITDANINTAITIINCVITLQGMPLEITHSADGKQLRIAPAGKANIPIEYYPWEKLSLHIKGFKDLLSQPATNMLLARKDGDITHTDLHTERNSDITNVLINATVKAAEDELGKPLSDNQYREVVANMNRHGKVLVNHNDSSKNTADTPDNDPLCLLHMQRIDIISVLARGQRVRKENIYLDNTARFSTELQLLLETLHIPVNREDIITTRWNNPQEGSVTYGLAVPAATIKALQKALELSSPSEHRMV